MFIDEFQTHQMDKWRGQLRKEHQDDIDPITWEIVRQFSARITDLGATRDTLIKSVTDSYLAGVAASKTFSPPQLDIPGEYNDIILLNQNDSHLVYKTPDVYMRIANQLVNFGQFGIMIDVCLNVRVYEMERNLLAEGFIFPFLSQGGVPCFGHAQLDYEKAKSDYDLKGILSCIHNWLVASYVDGATPYITPTKFLLVAKQAGQAVEAICRKCNLLESKCTCTFGDDAEEERCELCGETSDDCDCRECSRCDEMFSRDDLTMMDDDFYCSDCLSDVAFYCDGCDEHKNIDDYSYYHTQKGTLCSDCLVSYAERGKL